MPKVYIDAGHGGSDPGACGNSLRESDITLAISRLFKSDLERHGVQAIMSRNSDVFVGLSARPNEANNNGCNLLVSIHCNAASEAATGTESFTHPNDVAKTDALSKNVADRLAREFNLINRGAKEADFCVLRESVMPAILIETAFISNASDANLLRNYQEKFARCITQDVLAYFGISYIGNGAVAQPTPVSPSAPVTGSVTFFRVVVGSYENKATAQGVADKLSKEGNNAFLDAFKKDGKTFFRVIAGSFSLRQNAEAMKNELAKKGYTSFLAAYSKQGTVAPSAPVTPVAPTPAPSSGEYLNLKPHMESWSVYPIKSQPVSGNEIGKLLPSQYGGISYKILGNPIANIYTISTGAYGTVNIYAPRDNDSTITSSPAYGDSAPVEAPSGKQFVNLKPHNESWSVYNEAGPYSTANAVGKILPSQYGGISYEILESKGNDVYIIQTGSYGRVGIWVPQDNDSSFTSYAMY